MIYWYGRKKGGEMFLTQSMSWNGNYWDNTPMEPVFGHIKDIVLSEKQETLQYL